MALAQPPAPLSPYLAPATSEQFRNELTACLALVVPVGMTEDGRREWLSVAWKTLDYLPADILHKGCEKARATCDHPSKIVPTIVAETDDWMATRRKLAELGTTLLALPQPSQRDVMDRRGQPMSAEDTAELNRRIEWAGGSARYREDGTRYTTEAG